MNNHTMNEWQVEAHIGSSGYTTVMQAGKHKLTADEGIEYGGRDLGPSPYDFLLASLGSCTIITLRMYAQRKNWELSGIHVYLNHHKNYVDDCAHCNESKAKIDHIDRNIVLDGDLTQDQISRLMNIASKCPVHKTLSQGIHIETHSKEF